MFRAIRRVSTQTLQECNTLIEYALAGTARSPRDRTISRPATLKLANRAAISHSYPRSRPLVIDPVETTIASSETQFSESQDEHSLPTSEFPFEVLPPHSLQLPPSPENTNLTKSLSKFSAEIPPKDVDSTSTIPQPSISISFPSQPITLEEIGTAEVISSSKPSSSAASLSRPPLPSHHPSKSASAPAIPQPRDEILFPPQPTTVRQAAAASDALMVLAAFSSSLLLPTPPYGLRLDLLPTSSTLTQAIAVSKATAVSEAIADLGEAFEEQAGYEQEEIEVPNVQSIVRRQRNSASDQAEWEEYAKQLQAEHDRPWSQFEKELRYRYKDGRILPDHSKTMKLKPPMQLIKHFNIDVKEVQLLYFAINQSIKEIETTIGYGFQDATILFGALQAYKDAGPDFFPRSLRPDGNEGLSILGHSLMSAVLLADGYLTAARPEITRSVTDAILPSSSVNADYLAEVVIQAKLHKHIYTYGSVDTNDEPSKEVLANAIKAIMGAVFIDCDRRIGLVKRVMDKLGIVWPKEYYHKW